MNRPFVEHLHQGYAQQLGIGQVLADERSRFQHIQVFENDAFGRVLALDGIVQITERDEASYSEMLVHVPVFEHGDVQTVLIVGGGDGAVAEEVLKHDSVEAVDLVEIDPRVVELAREHLSSVHGDAFSDPRLSVHFEDAFQYLSDVGGRYDLVIADRPDPVGPAVRLFEETFYRRVSSALRASGTAVFQTGAPFFQAGELRDTLRLLRSIWIGVDTYLTVTPTYAGGYFALTRAAEEPVSDAILEKALDRARAASLSTRHYSPEIHRASYALPSWIAAMDESV